MEIVSELGLIYTQSGNYLRSPRDLTLELTLSVAGIEQESPIFSDR